MEYKLILADKTYKGILVETNSDWDFLDYELRDLNPQDIVIDLETTGLNCYLGDKIAGVAIYIPRIGTAFYVPFRHAEGFNWNLDFRYVLHSALIRSQNNYIGWNLNFDLQFLLNEGFNVYNMGSVEDAMFALHLLDENRRDRGQNYKLKDVAKQFIDAKAADSDIELQRKLTDRGIKKGQMYQLPANNVAEYAMMDVILSWELRQFFMPYLEKWLVVDLYKELNLFLKDTIVRMESNGVFINRDLCANSVASVEIQAKNCLQQIREKAGYDINPNSPAQVAKWLGTKDAKAQTLTALQETDERAALIQEYKFYTKAVSTFYDPYLKWSEGDGKLHTNIHVTGTVSGRPSFSEPNLGQVPAKDKKYDVKKIFVAPEGYKLVQFDYSQQELRLAAYFTQEQRLIDALNSGDDIHQITADAVGLSRKQAKVYNFAILYGAGASKLAWMTNDKVENAKENLKRFDELYPNLRPYMWNKSELAKYNRDPDGSPNGVYNFIRLLDGRVRHYNGPNAPFYSAFNTEVQGTGAIIMRRALMRICDIYPYNTDQVIPIMTVYDSFIAYIKHDKAFDTNIQTIKYVMEDYPQFNPKMVVDVEYGDNWYDLEKWNNAP